MHKIIVKKKIQVPLNIAHKRIWDISSWASFWNPLQKIEILYDDGLHQDFKMLVDWQGRNSWVRTIRFCNPNLDVAFFSPQPPPPTSIHQGLWQFAVLTDTLTELTAVRYFELPQAELEESEEYSMRLIQFSQDFQTRLQDLLQKLGDSCER